MGVQLNSVMVLKLSCLWDSDCPDLENSLQKQHQTAASATEWKKSLLTLSPKIYRRGELECEEIINNPSCFTDDQDAGIKQPCTIASAIALVLFVKNFFLLLSFFLFCSFYFYFNSLFFIPELRTIFLFWKKSI